MFLTADHRLNQVLNMLRQTFAAKREKVQPSLFILGLGKVGLDGGVPIPHSASIERQESAVEKPKKLKQAGLHILLKALFQCQTNNATRKSKKKPLAQYLLSPKESNLGPSNITPN